MENIERLNPDMTNNLLRNLPSMVYRCINDANRTILYVSGECELVTGYQPQELIRGGMIDYEELILPEDRAAVREAISQGAKQNTYFQATYRIKRKDSSIGWIWEQGIGVQLPEDKATYLHGVITDITRTRVLELQLEESIDKLEYLNRVKDRLLNFVLHDLQGPVFSFISLCDFLSQNIESLSNEQLIEYLNQFRDSSQRMSLILEGVYRWAKLQKQMDNLQPRLIRLETFIADLRKGFRPHYESKNISLIFDYPPQGEVYSDMNLLFILTANLLSNAIKYSHPGSEVNMSFAIDGDQLIISVTDTGVGIPGSKIKHLFNPQNEYVRNGTGKETGSGLGLILTKRTLDKIGGTIEVKSKLGKGSTFTIRMPARL